MNAFPNATGRIYPLTREQIDHGCRAAAASPRKRIIQPVHRSQSDHLQRIVNFLQPGTYIRPHIHPAPGQAEFIHVLQGRIGFLTFHPGGELDAAYDLSAGPLGVIDIVEGVWHSLICLAPDTVITEAKLGPYDPLRDKVFASWAPDETDPAAAAEALQRLTTAFQQALRA